jgi:hypothetical protein
VRKVLHAFNEHGFESLNPKAGTGRPKTFEPPLRERIEAISLAPPTTVGEPLTHWSLRRLKSYLERRNIVPRISIETLRCMLRERNVTFQRTRTWKRSTDPAFEQKPTRVMALYRTCPSDGWWCASMSSGRSRSNPTLVTATPNASVPRADGRPTCGVAESATSSVPTTFTDVLFGGYRLVKTATEVLAFYKYIRRRYPERLRIDLVKDNLSLHWTSRIRAWAGARRGTGADADLGQLSESHRMPLQTPARVRAERLGLLQPR